MKFARVPVSALPPPDPPEQAQGAAAIRIRGATKAVLVSGNAAKAVRFWLVLLNAALLSPILYAVYIAAPPSIHVLMLICCAAFNGMAGACGICPPQRGVAMDTLL